MEAGGNPPDAGTPTGPVKVLVYRYAQGFPHQSRVDSIPLIRAMGMVNNAFTIQDTFDPGFLTDANLEPFDVIFALNSTGSFMLYDKSSSTTDNVPGKPNDTAAIEKQHEQALERFMAKGRGFVGAHGATDTTYTSTWPWYVDLTGSTYDGHSGQGVSGGVAIDPGATSHIILRGLPSTWQRNEEWYRFFRDVSGVAGFTVLLRAVNAVTEDPTKSMTTGKANRPIGWIKEVAGGGRMFYTAFGHDTSTFNEPLIRTLYTNAILWAGHRTN
jgi:type 1 glutamine amidotransferase